jgi:quinol monooxygenase YgiN
MICLMVTYVFESDEKREEFFEGLYANNIPDTFLNEKGNMMYDYFFPVENDNELLLVEKWENQADLDAHGKSGKMELLSKLKTELVKDVKIEKYQA